MHRFRILLLTVASTTVLASTADALPQASTGGARTTVRTRCVNCSTTRDSSLRARQEQLLLKFDSLRWQIDNVNLTNAERARVEREMTRTVAAMESSIGETMAAEAVGARIAVEVGPTRAAIAAPSAMVAVETLQPQGYLGATFDGPHIKFIRDNQLHVRFYQYPKIAMVEESSPARRAGILDGDTLLALGGTDVKNEISLTKLLVPDARIIVRVRREGDARDLSVTVREAPDYYVMRSTPLPARAPRGPVRMMPPEQVRVPGEPMPPIAVAPTPRAGGPRAGGTMWIYNNGVAGAHVQTISEGLGKTVGVKEGVLVISVERGTPAYRSGLRDGDVILRAGASRVATVNALRQAVAEGAGDEGVRLRILRERKQRDVTLRW